MVCGSALFVCLSLKQYFFVYSLDEGKFCDHDENSGGNDPTSIARKGRPWGGQDGLRQVFGLFNTSKQVYNRLSLFFIYVCVMKGSGSASSGQLVAA